MSLVDEGVEPLGREAQHAHGSLHVRLTDACEGRFVDDGRKVGVSVR